MGNFDFSPYNQVGTQVRRVCPGYYDEYTLLNVYVPPEVARSAYFHGRGVGLYFAMRNIFEYIYLWL